MPTLCFSKDFDASERRILTKTFKVNCADLKIDKHDITVALRKISRPDSHWLGSVINAAKDHFLVLANTQNVLSQSIFMLGHECVHIKQHRTGQLRTAKEGSFWNKDFYHNTYCNSKLFYERLPWEIEAHARQDKLFENALRVLNLDDASKICAEMQWAT